MLARLQGPISRSPLRWATKGTNSMDDHRNHPTAFQVNLTGPRTTCPPLTRWVATLVQGRRRLTATRNATPGTINGARFDFLWVYVEDNGQGEPWTSAQRRTATSGAYTQAMTDGARKLIAHHVAVALREAGGFGDVWESLYREQHLSNSREDIVAKASMHRAIADWLDECAELGELLTAGLLQIDLITSPERIRLVDDPLFPDPAWNQPSARIMDGETQVGWLTTLGNPSPLRSRPK
jgi:hypothetical protein